MQSLSRGVSAALDVVARAAIAIAGVAMVAMVLIVAWGVFGRFVLNDTPAWAEASALLLLGWVILGAAAAGVREGFHMGFDTLRDVLPAPVTRVFQVLSDLVVTLFGAAGHNAAVVSPLVLAKAGFGFAELRTLFNQPVGEGDAVVALVISTFLGRGRKSGVASGRRGIGFEHDEHRADRDLVADLARDFDHAARVW